MPLRLYNTRTHRVEELSPLEPDHVRIYVCGLTPSAEGHLGHARSFLFFDVLRRYLEHPRNGYRVTYVQNVTDIDDRSIATAQREGTTYDAVVSRYYGAFKESMRALGVREPDREPYATKYIPQIVDMIAELIARGYAYATDDGVYYKVAAFPRYGALSGKNIDELLVGARIAENEHKRDPLDFALWKFAKRGEPQWESPWGGGRPGWHIECSAMSRALLGVPFDIHGGGYDLIFPHHENEIAQSEPLMEKPPMAVTWVHGGLLNYDGRKMSKSLGNFEPLTDLLQRHDALAIRLLFLQTGYRKPMNFTEESIAGAKASLQKLQKAALRLREDSAESASGRSDESEAEKSSLDQLVDARRAAIFQALDDDMDTAQALGALHSALAETAQWKSIHRADEVLSFTREVAAIFGLAPAFEDSALDEFTAEAQMRRARDAQSALDPALVDRLRARLDGVVHLNGVVSPEGAIEAVIAARTQARKDKDFALGDRLRDALAAEGIVLKDAKDGTTWTVAGT
ncbi:MAG: cysteinyl-tRNA synthetase [Candidatus Eremiobacteraeota bacterium]|nr:cysteinyl-tRNA synthetase [Candidatus Eremiobacteraeota bacterium]